ncbi:MAG: RNase adapter RapZ [Firmicutes bacterium]|nr:RNase adapter RapZ [Bacillota bacterium]
MEVVLINGLSGAGKTKAADWFEDRDYYCIDNMPPALIRNFIDLAMSGSRQIEKAAFVIDIRGGQFLGGIENIVGELARDEAFDFKILYIEASDEALIRRYKENRRIHPLSMAPISREIIAREREMLAGLRAQATYIIDTSFLKVAEFNSQLDSLFRTGTETESFLIDIQSFGFKKGVPQEADIVMDVRFIPNPYYVPSLKALTGNNKKVSQYVLKHRVTKDFIESMHTMLARLIPCYVKEGKYSLRIAFGCTGGQHRSVAVANEMARIFREEGRRVTLEHREL